MWLEHLFQAKDASDCALVQQQEKLDLDLSYDLLTTTVL